MNQRLLIILLALTVGYTITGCTSDNSAQDSEESVVSEDDSFSEENSGDFQEGGEAQAATEGAPEGGESVDDTALDDGAPAEGAGDQAATTPPADGAAPADPAAPAEGAETDELALDDGADPANEFPDEVAGADAAPTDAAPADPSATPDAATETAATGEQPSDSALFDPAAGGDQQASSEPPAVDAGAADASSTDVASSDTGDSSSTDVAASEPEPAPAKTYLPLLKIKDAPFEVGGTLLNRFYVAREGDTTKSVSQKIYGSNRSKDLKKWNVLLANRPMKVGDKVYYNSPKDPADSSKMVSWYEENGVAPSTYTAQEGDDIRELSTKLLGNKNSWKELWATNMDVESKGALPAGTEIRYFPADATEQAVASNAAPATDAAPAAPADQAAAQPMDQGLPPGDPTLNQQPDIAMNEPGQDMNANAGTVAPPTDMGAPPPPPPDMAQAAPPPPPMEPMQAPPPPKPTTRAAAADDEMAGDPDQTMMLGAAGLLLLGGVLAFSVIRRKRNSKRIDMTQTQI